MKKTNGTTDSTSNSVLKAAGDFHSVPVNRQYKDTLFRMIFREKDSLLSLYNAVNGTSYTDTSHLEIVTLENAIWELS